MKTKSLNELRYWYKGLVGCSPLDSATEAELRWEIAYWLIKLNDNALTCAHVLTDLRWDLPEDVPALEAAVAKIKAAWEDKPGPKVFEERLQELYK